MRLLFQSAGHRLRPLKRKFEIIDTEEQQQPVARRPMIRGQQGGMLVGSPFVEAEQDGSVGVEDLPKIVMSGRCSRLTEQLWYYFTLFDTSRTPMIVHVRFIVFSLASIVLQPGYRY